MNYTIRTCQIIMNKPNIPRDPWHGTLKPCSCDAPATHDVNIVHKYLAHEKFAICNSHISYVEWLKEILNAEVELTEIEPHV